MDDNGRVRIGELSRRVGESPELLRAWEARYGLVTPERTHGGLRLYSEEDERRVRLMRHHIDAGLSASEAARLAKLGAEAAPASAAAAAATVVEIHAALRSSLDELDGPSAQAVLDRLLTTSAIGPAVADVILPFLNQLGSRWAAGEITAAQEHFASNLIGGRLRTLSRGWGEGVGPRAILACPPGEQHELGLTAFGLALRERGWRITYLGANTPLETIPTTLDGAPPAIVVLSAVTEQRFLDNADGVARLAAQVRTGLGGAGATAALAASVGAELLAGEMLEVAAALTP